MWFEIMFWEFPSVDHFCILSVADQISQHNEKAKCKPQNKKHEAGKDSSY